MSVHNSESLQTPPVRPAPMNRKACPGCGAALPVDAVMCVKCGFSVYRGEHVTSGWTIPAAAPQSEPSFVLAPLLLLFRPSLFFRHFAALLPGILSAMLFWLWGMAYMADRIETRFAIASIAGQPSFLPRDWVTFWGVVMIGAILSGAMIAWVGGWWYRQRLALCGAHDVDPRQARRTYVLAATVYFIPALALRLYQTARFRAPIECFGAELSWSDLAQILFVAWSSLTIYASARSVFAARRGWAALWFVILPLAFHSVAIVAMLYILSSMLGMPRIIVKQCEIFDNGLVKFAYPLDWRMTSDGTGNDLDGPRAITIDSGFGASIDLTVYRSTALPEDDLRSLANTVMAMLRDSHEGEPISEWGRHRGVGTNIRGVSENHAVTIRLFVTRLDAEWLLEVRETCIGVQPVHAEQDFEMIRSTLRRLLPEGPRSNSGARTSNAPLPPYEKELIG